MSSVKAIYAGLRVVGLDDEEERRDLYARVTGKRSLREMTPAEKDAVVVELRRLGFKPGGLRKPAPRADIRMAHVLWRRLHQARVVDAPGAAGLNAFVRARFAAAWGVTPIDIDAMREASQIAAVLEALKAMCRRNGLRP